MGATLRTGLVAAAAAVAVGLAVLPVEGRVGAEVEVVDSNAGGAAIGLTSRVPAQSAGGFVVTAAAITLDKAVAKAGGFTAGDLVEGGLSSSSEKYRNPTLIAAQYPPTGTVPAEARGGSDAGGATLHAAATERPSATAEAEGARAGDAATVAVRHGTSLSHGELGPDGVVTRGVAVASGISIGGVVTIASATTEAVATVPRRGRPTTDLKVLLAGLLVGGIPAELTDQGLRISDQAPAGAAQLAAFNAATAQLAERGVVVTAAPALRETGADRARAEGGAVLVRYKVADQAGGDEEVVIAQAHSRSTLVLAEAKPPLPELLEVESGRPAQVPAASGGAPAGSTPPPTAANSADTAGIGYGSLPDGSLVLTGPGAGLDASLALTDPGSGLAAMTGAPADIEGVDTTGFDAGSAAPAGATATESVGGVLNLVDRPHDPAVTRLRSGYRFFLLLAAVGAAVHFATHRTRPT